MRRRRTRVSVLLSVLLLVLVVPTASAGVYPKRWVKAGLQPTTRSSRSRVTMAQSGSR